MVYVIQGCWQLASRIRTELHPDPARKLSANLYDMYQFFTVRTAMVYIMQICWRLQAADTKAFLTTLNCNPTRSEKNLISWQVTYYYISLIIKHVTGDIKDENATRQGICSWYILHWNEKELNVKLQDMTDLITSLHDNMKVFQIQIQLLIIKPTRCINFSNLFFGIKFYMFRTVPLSIIRSLVMYTQQ